MRALAGFGGGDIGEDHELLDQPVRLEPLRHDHAIDGAVGFEHDLAFGNVEIERAALVAGAQHRAIGGVERLEDVSTIGSVTSSGRPETASCACS